VSVTMLIKPCNLAPSDGSHPASAFLIEVQAAE